MAIVDLEQNTASPLSAQQTEAGLSTPSETAPETTAPKGNRINLYLGHLADCMNDFPESIRYVVADGFYSK